MTYYVICTTDAAPCPPDFQIEVTQIGLDELAQMGITPETLATALGVGFGIVVSLALVGYAAGCAIRLLNKL